MSNKELTETNYNRIYRLNWLISGPLLVILGWPYLLLAEVLELNFLSALLGALFFSVPFSLTILHGHISVAVGTLHRDRYYAWQNTKTGVYKYTFNPVLFTTRVRLILISLSILILVLGLILK